jgi:hypothetical protein
MVAVVASHAAERKRFSLGTPVNRSLSGPWPTPPNPRRGGCPLLARQATGNRARNCPGSTHVRLMQSTLASSPARHDRGTMSRALNHMWRVCLIPACRSFSRKNFTWYSARRHTRRVSNESYVVDQRKNSKIPWSHRAAFAARTCRRGDRIDGFFAAVHESAFGTKRTPQRAQSMSAFGDKADVAPGLD